MKQIFNSLSYHLPVVFTAMLGLIISVLLIIFISANKEKMATKAFNNEAEKLIDDISDSVKESMRAIYHLSSYFKSTRHVSHEDFNEYVSGFISHYSEIQAMEWVPRVSSKDRMTHEISQSLYKPGYKITQRNKKNMLVPAKWREYYFPVTYIFPLKENETAIGFDLASNPVRKSMLEYSFLYKTIAVSNRIRLVQEKGRSYAVLIALPITKDNKSYNTLNNPAIKGVVLGVFRIESILNKIINSYAIKPIEIIITERPKTHKPALLFHWGTVKKSPIRLTMSKKIKVGNQVWEVRILGDPEDFGGGTFFESLILFIVGLTFTSLITAYIHLIRTSHRHANKITSQLTDEIKIRSKYEKLLLKSNNKLEALSREDPLTGIANRRAFNDYLKSEWDRSNRSKKPLSLIIADIDNFKSYNDSYGHIMGDHCLKKVAQAFSAATNRQSDLVARYGGEEIAVILPETSEDGAIKVAEDIRNAVKKIDIPHEGLGQKKVVTVSLGVTTIHDVSGYRQEEMIRMADEALYTAKSLGKNIVIHTKYIPGQVEENFIKNPHSVSI